MEKEKDLQIQRFKIIEPFLRKEKKLKTIEEESGISYATLKRWVNAYKKNGVLGLDKKQRNDKDSFRKVDNKGIKIIEEFCRECEETKISQLYSIFIKKLSFKYNISYPTFYRIVSNLDGFFNKSTSFHLEKIKKENLVYLILEIPLYILVSDNEDEKIVPQLLISLDVADMKPISFELNYTQSNLYILLAFIRETLLKVSIFNNKYIKPQDILVSSENISNKKILKNIYDTLGIKVSEYFTENKEILKFIDYLIEDIEKFYSEREKRLSYEELKEFLNSYIYLENPKYNFIYNNDSLESLNYIRNLDVFLQEVNRKVTRNSIRVNNLIYSDENLKEFEGETVTVKFNPLDTKNILIFFKDKFLGIVSLE
ncbi:MAG: Mu transposase C-terminal domain-containing protein [Fusobacterium sp.]|uniref:Mu transposase C-terminal domain-containing protein n=1 Tax=Fusobacterium sp. TaxID=68766 RepID=UPI00399A6AA3